MVDKNAISNTDQQVFVLKEPLNGFVDMGYEFPSAHLKTSL